MIHIKKLMLLPAIAIMPLISLAQNWNPWVNSGTISPAPLLPLELNGAGILSFNVGNSGSDTLTVGAAANQKLKLVITLSDGVPDNVNPLAAVSGTMAPKFSWAYDAAQKTYTATQVQPLPGLDAGTILIAYKVTQNSTSAASANGFNVNLTAPAYASLSNSQPDDNASSYTNTSLSIGGMVLNDANGQTDNIINGTPMNPGGLIAVLFNTSGITLATAMVSAAGAYSFPDREPGSYNILITTAPATVGTPAPAITLPANWVSTAEGVTAAGDGTVNGTTPVTLVAATISNANFGLDRLPNSTPVSVTAPAPVLNAMITLNGGVNNYPAPSGTDDEDGALQSGKKLMITGLPSNATLLYNNNPVTTNMVITGFDPDQLRLQATAATLLAASTSFLFAYIDAAGKQDPTPASYAITWGTPLPVTMGSFAVVAENDRARLDWTTFSEKGNTGFDIERSTDSKSWKKIGFEMSKAQDGNSDRNLQYVAYDEQPVRGLNAYRLRQTDKDGKVAYSEVRQASFGNDGSMQVYPNPATDIVYLRTKDWDNIQEVRVSDETGRLLFLAKDAANGVSIAQLAKATYLLQVVKKDGSISGFKIIKQ